MKIEIDIDKLRAKKAELETELSRISGLLDLAEQFGTPASIPLPAPPVNGMAALPSPLERRGHTAGLRRQVVLALYTGPLTEKELKRSLAWDDFRTKRVIGPMLTAKMCFLNEHGALQLAPDGLRMAQWFLAYPKYLEYRPKQFPLPAANAAVAK